MDIPAPTQACPSNSDPPKVDAMGEYVSMKNKVSDVLGDIGNLLGDITEGPKGPVRAVEGDPNNTLQLDLQLNSFFRFLTALKKRRDEPLALAVLALTKSGKSTLINALLSSEAMPMNNVPETARLVRIVHSPASLITLQEGDKHYKGAPAVMHRLQELNSQARCHDSVSSPTASMPPHTAFTLGSPGAAFPSPDDILLIQAPITALSEYDTIAKPEDPPRLCLLDTPGPNEAGEEKLKFQVERLLDDVDAVLYLLDYTKLKTQEEEGMLRRLKEINPRLLKRLAQRLFFVVNKVDSVHVSEGLGFDATRQYVADLVTRQLGCEGFCLEPEQVILISARNALLSRLVLSEQASEESMRRFLTLAFGYAATATLSPAATTPTPAAGARAAGRRAQMAPAPIPPEQVVCAAYAMLDNSGIEDLEQQVLAFLYAHGGNIKLMALVDDAARLLHGISNVATSCHVMLQKNVETLEREDAILKQQLESTLDKFDEVMRDTDVVASEVSDEIRCHLSSLRSRLFSQIIQTLQIDSESLPGGTSDSFAAAAVAAATHMAGNSTNTPAPGRWQRIREKVLSIFSSPQDNSFDGAGPSVQPVAQTRSKEEMSRLLKELHEDLMAQVHSEATEFWHVLEACTNARHHELLSRINANLELLSRRIESTVESSLEIRLHPVDIKMQMPSASDFHSDLQQLIGRGIKETRQKHIRVAERQFEERVRQADGFCKWGGYWESVPRTRTVVETYVTTMYELQPGEVASHFIQMVDAAINSTERALRSYVDAFVQQQLVAARQEVKDYSERYLSAISGALEASNHGTEYRQAALIQVQGYIDQIHAIQSKLEVVQAEAELQVPHIQDATPYEELDMDGDLDVEAVCVSDTAAAADTTAAAATAAMLPPAASSDADISLGPEVGADDVTPLVVDDTIVAEDCAAVSEDCAAVARDCAAVAQECAAVAEACVAEAQACAVEANDCAAVAKVSAAVAEDSAAVAEDSPAAAEDGRPNVEPLVDEFNYFLLGPENDADVLLGSQVVGMRGMSLGEETSFQLPERDAEEAHTPEVYHSMPTGGGYDAGVAAVPVPQADAGMVLLADDEHEAVFLALCKTEANIAMMADLEHMVAALPEADHFPQAADLSQVVLGCGDTEANEGREEDAVDAREAIEEDTDESNGESEKDAVLSCTSSMSGNSYKELVTFGSSELGGDGEEQLVSDDGEEEEEEEFMSELGGEGEVQVRSDDGAEEEEEEYMSELGGEGEVQVRSDDGAEEEEEEYMSDFEDDVQSELSVPLIVSEGAWEGAAGQDTAAHFEDDVRSDLSVPLCGAAEDATAPVDILDSHASSDFNSCSGDLCNSEEHYNTEERYEGEEEDSEEEEESDWDQAPHEVTLCMPHAASVEGEDEDSEEGEEEVSDWNLPRREVTHCLPHVTDVEGEEGDSEEEEEEDVFDYNLPRREVTHCLPHVTDVEGEEGDSEEEEEEEEVFDYYLPRREVTHCLPHVTGVEGEEEYSEEGEEEESNEDRPPPLFSGSDSEEQEDSEENVFDYNLPRREVTHCLPLVIGVEGEEEDSEEGEEEESDEDLPPPLFSESDSEEEEEESDGEQEEEEEGWESEEEVEELEEEDSSICSLVEYPDSISTEEAAPTPLEATEEAAPTVLEADATTGADMVTPRFPSLSNLVAAAGATPPPNDLLTSDAPTPLPANKTAPLNSEQASALTAALNADDAATVNADMQFLTPSALDAATTNAGMQVLPPSSPAPMPASNALIAPAPPPAPLPLSQSGSFDYSAGFALAMSTSGLLKANSQNMESEGSDSGGWMLVEGDASDGVEDME